jgi:lipopolysaccharide biosynthesis glycosyltransferase
MNLLYVLVNYNTKYYLDIFKIFLKSLILFSKTRDFDFLIICDDKAYNSLKDFGELKLFHKHYFLKVPIDTDLKFALLRKFDISKFKHFNEYEKIMYIDVDIIVQNDILDIINNVPAQDNILYAAKEGEVDGPYWYLNTYKNSNIKKLKDEHINSFNSGMFLFKATEEMKTHFKNVKKFSLNYYNKPHKNHFYDQSMMNFYFNMKRLANTDYFNDIYLMFPDTTKFYNNKTILHIAGIGRYKEKANIMNNYLDLIIKNKRL